MYIILPSSSHQPPYAEQYSTQMKISSVTLNSSLARVLRNQWSTPPSPATVDHQPSTTLKNPLSLSLFSGGLLDLVHDVLDLLADLSGVGGQQLGQLVDLASQGGAQFLGGGLQLGLETISLGLQLLAQALSLGLQHGGDVAQLLGGGVTGLLDVGLNMLLHGVQVLGGAGLELTQVGGNSA